MNETRMSRPLRIAFPGAWYHIMNRSAGKINIFNNGQQCQVFLDLLADIYQQYGVETHAYCLMSNHYHLLLHTPRGNISRAMRHLNGVYTQRYNHLEQRDGPLFRGRYKSILIDADHYLVELSRYIHLNPVKAKMVFSPEQFKWSSYRSYLRLQPVPGWLHCEEVLEQFSSAWPALTYKKFVEENIDPSPDKFFDAGNHPGVLGDETFVSRIRANIQPRLLQDPEVPAARRIAAKRRVFASIDELMEKVAGFYQISTADLKHRGNRYYENQARNMAIYFSGRVGGFSNAEIGGYFGGIGVSAVSQIKRRVHAGLLQGSKTVRDELKKLSGFLQVSY